MIDAFPIVHVFCIEALALISAHLLEVHFFNTENKWRSFLALSILGYEGFVFYIH